MNNNASQAERGTSQPSAGFMRRDFATAALVEQSIALQEQAGTKYAAVFLDYKGISVDIALRVLLRPNERRRATGQLDTPAQLPS